MKKIVLLLILASSCLYGAILNDLDKTDLKRYKGKFKEIVKSEKAYKLGLDYLNQNLKHLDFLKKELDKVDYSTYDSSKEPKDLSLLKTMNYMKLLTIDALKKLKNEDEKEFIKSLNYQIKFFKIVLKKNVLLNQMIVIASELTLFTGTYNMLKAKGSYKESRELIKVYYDFRKEQFVKTTIGEFELMKTELLSTFTDNSKEFPVMKRKDIDRMLAYVIKEQKTRLDKIIKGVKERKGDEYFKNIDKEVSDLEFNSKVFRAYIVLALSVMRRDLKKEYRVPKIYLELVGDIFINLSSISGQDYKNYYNKDIEVMDILKQIVF